MFEDALELWRRYSTVCASSWQADDARHRLLTEVRERLEQLDIVLELLRAALKLVAIDPGRAMREAEWVRFAAPRLRSGELTHAEFEAGFDPKPNNERRAVVRAWSEIRLFTETFYLVAWRLRELLNGSGSRKFPRIRRLEAKAIRNIRNLLIAHPERSRVPNYEQSLVVTDAGPVLKSKTVIFRGATGRVDPDDESVDRGLYVNAGELRCELESRFMEALKEPLESLGRT